MKTKLESEYDSISRTIEVAIWELTEHEKLGKAYQQLKDMGKKLRSKKIICYEDFMKSIKHKS